MARLKEIYKKDVVPALIKLGAIEPAAHMFAFYFAILSAITPPVALAVFAAAVALVGAPERVRANSRAASPMEWLHP